MSRPLLILAAFPLLACATDAPSPSKGQTSLGGGISTLGGIVEGRHRVSDQFAIRGFVAGGLSMDETQTEEGVEYEVDASFGGVGVAGAYYPMGEGLYLSGGLFLPRTDITASASDSALEVGDATYDASIEAEAEFSRAIAPMLSVGYDHRLGDWSLGAELGAIAVGGVDVEIRETTVGGNVIAAGDLDAETDELDDALSEIDILPFVTLRATYTF